MAITQDGLDQDQNDFKAAFDEDMPAATEPSEDEAFGLNLEAAAPDANAEPAGESAPGEEGEPAAVVMAVADSGELQKNVEDDQAHETADASTEAMNAKRGSGEPVDPEKEAQRLRSWEGRLKAMEAELKKAGAKTDEEQSEAVGEAIEKAADSADTPADEEKVEQIAEQVESGQLTAEQAMKQLAEDFGDDFVKMIEAIAVSKAKEAGSTAAHEKVGELGKTVEEIINAIGDDKQRAHFEQIADKHPDFNEIANSEDFAKWIEAMPEGEQEKAKQVATGGTAKEINKLLDTFKAQQEQQDAGGETDLQAGAMDDAEGVRSSGIRLPEQPSASQDDYLGNWDKF